MSSEELLTVEELASYLKLKPRTLYPKLRNGELPAFKIFGQWRFRKSEIDKWLGENMRTTQKQERFKTLKTEIQQPVESQS